MVLQWLRRIVFWSHLRPEDLLANCKPGNPIAIASADGKPGNSIAIVFADGKPDNSSAIVFADGKSDDSSTDPSTNPGAVEASLHGWFARLS